MKHYPPPRPIRLPDLSKASPVTKKNICIDIPYVDRKWCLIESASMIRISNRKFEILPGKINKSTGSSANMTAYR